MQSSLVVMMTIGGGKIPLFLFLTIHAVNSALRVWFVCVFFVLELRDSDYLSPFS